MIDLVSVREAVEQTGRKEGDIRYLIRTGRLRIIRVGYHVLIPRKELQKLLAGKDKTRG